jgi:hypothetical protein
MKKIFSFIICLILISTIFSINSISNPIYDPEIKDEISDTLFRFIDIKSVRFYEDSDEPEFLFITMELNNLRSSWFGGLYQIEWIYEDEIYASFVSIGYRGNSIPKGFISGIYGRGTNNDLFEMPSCEGNINFETGIISWKIQKINIGNPKQGDILKEPWSKSCFSGIYGIMSFIRYIPLIAKDLAPTYTDEDGLNRFEYGKNYIIKY